MDNLETFTLSEHAFCDRCDRQGATLYKGWAFMCPPCHRIAMEEDE